MHYVIEGAIPEFLDWLGIEPDEPPEIINAIFTGETLIADLLLKVGNKRLVHVEYVRSPRADMFSRMVIYRGHIMRRYPELAITQYAIVLGSGRRLRPYDDPANGFFLGLNIIYLSDVDPAEFLSRPRLAVLAELARGDQLTRAQSAVAALHLIETLPMERHQGLREALLGLATISLQPHTIDLIRKETGMSVQSVAEFYNATEIGQEIRKQGQEQGRKQGQEQGREQGREQTLAALLQVRFGNDPRIPAIAHQLMQALDDHLSLQAITEASSLIELIERIPPPV